MDRTLQDEQVQNELEQITAERDLIRKQVEQLRTEIRIAHDLLRDLADQPIPNLMAIREAIQILRGAL